MAKSSFLQIFVALLIVSAAMQIQETNAQKRCIETLYTTGCTLADCGQKCWTKHHSTGRQCIPNQAMTNYACVCAWDC